MIREKEENCDPEYDGLDCPRWDGTDLAHPAWWRGCDVGVETTIQVIHKILDDIENGVEPCGSYGSKKMELLSKRLYQDYDSSWISSLRRFMNSLRSRNTILP